MLSEYLTHEIVSRPYAETASGDKGRRCHRLCRTGPASVRANQRRKRWTACRDQPAQRRL